MDKRKNGIYHLHMQRRKNVVISWFAAFKVIPWANVVYNAPAVLRAAKKFWDVVSRSGPQVEQRPDSRHSETISALEARLFSLEQETAQLREQSIIAAELLSALAEQNMRLVEAIELLRLRTRILVVLSCVLIAAVVAMAAFAIFR